MTFVAYTIDEKAHNAMLQYLGEIPAKFANPLISTLNTQARIAAAQGQNVQQRSPGKKGGSARTRRG